LGAHCKKLRRSSKSLTEPGKSEKHFQILTRERPFWKLEGFTGKKTIEKKWPKGLSHLTCPRGEGKGLREEACGKTSFSINLKRTSGTVAADLKRKQGL